MLQGEPIYKNQMLLEIGTACQQGKGKIPWFYSTNYFLGRSTVFGCLNLINKLLLVSVLSWLIILTSVLGLKMDFFKTWFPKWKDDCAMFIIADLQLCYYLIFIYHNDFIKTYITWLGKGRITRSYIKLCWSHIRTCSHII